MAGEGFRRASGISYCYTSYVLSSQLDFELFGDRLMGYVL